MPQPAGSFREEQAEYRILMDGWPTAKNKVNAKHRDRTGAFTTRLKCMQINLQHSRLATDNLLKIMEDTDIICIQQPYNIGNKIGGLPCSRTVLTAGEGKKRAAIVINIKHIDAILITQLPDEYATVMETREGKVSFVIASMYFDIKHSIDEDLKKNASSNDTRKRNRDCLCDRQQCTIHIMAWRTD
jgi:hypothetical protein